MNLVKKDINTLLKNDQSFINPVRFNLKYVLDNKYTCKAIYDEVRKDLFNELKDKKVLDNYAVKIGRAIKKRPQRSLQARNV